MMCFAAYFRLGHDEYRGDIKQIRSGMTWAEEKLGHDGKTLDKYSHIEAQ